MKKETIIRSKSDFVKGLGSSIPYYVNIPNGDWRPFVSDNQEQMLRWDENCCSQLSPAKTAMEGQLNWLLANNLFTTEALNFFNSNGYIQNGKFYISYQFNAILDGTSINGNNPVATAISYGRDGIIPRTMLNMTLQQSAQYDSQLAQDTAFYSKSNITPQMTALGLQSLQYISVAYQWVNDDDGQSTPIAKLLEAIKQSPLVLGLPIPADVSVWNSGQVTWDGGKQLEHCVGLTFIDTTDTQFPFYIEDNYIPFQKQLSANYWIDQVLQIIVSPTPTTAIPEPTIPVSWAIALINLLKQWSQGFVNGIIKTPKTT